MKARTAKTAGLLSSASARIASLEKKPERNGTPMMAATAIVNVQNVRGILDRRPPIRKMSCSWWQPKITEPEPRKSSALKKACVVRWNIAPADRAQPEGGDHVAELRERRVGEDLLDVALRDGAERGVERGQSRRPTR